MKRILLLTITLILFSILSACGSTLYQAPTLSPKVTSQMRVREIPLTGVDLNKSPVGQFEYIELFHDKVGALVVAGSQTFLLDAIQPVASFSNW